MTLKRFLLLISLTFCTNTLPAQHSKGTKAWLSLDSVFTFTQIPPHIQFSAREYILGTIADSSFYFFSHAPHFEEGNNFKIYSINLYSHEVDSFNVTIPNFKHEVNKDWFFSSFTVNDKYAALSLESDKAVFLFTRSGKTFTYKEKINIDESIGYIKLLDNNLLFIGHNRKYHPKQEKNNTSFLIYDLANHQKIKTLTPSFNFLEYTLMAPNHYIDAMGKEILFAQGKDYSIDVFDNSLNTVSTIKKHSDGWVPLNDTIMNKLRAKYPDPSDVIGIVQELPAYDMSTSRIKAAYFMNENLVWVKYFMPAEPQKKYNMLNDVWKRTNGKWKLLISDIDDRGEKTEVVKKDSIELASISHVDLFFTKNKIVQMRMEAPINPVGRSSSEKHAMQQKYLVDHEPVIRFYVYTHKL